MKITRLINLSVVSTGQEFFFWLKPWQNKKDQTFVGMHRFLNPFLKYFNQLPAAKKGFKNGASQQKFGPSYFAKALADDWLPDSLLATFEFMICSKLAIFWYVAND